MGIEPTLVAWEATVLPLNYTRTGLILFTGPVFRQAETQPATAMKDIICEI